jgi:predicted GNAT family acetyltransferase
MNPDRFATALTDVWRYLNTQIPGSRLVRSGGAAAWLTGFPTSAFNGICLEQPNPSASAVAALLDEAEHAQVPFGLSLRPGSDAALADLAAERGMKQRGERPLMVLDATAGAPEVRLAQGLAIRQIGPDEAAAHTKVAAGTFGGPEEMLLPGHGILGLGDVRCYVGEADGRPVATVVGVTVGEVTAIYSAATDPAFRRRGYGTALTSRAVAEGVLAGAAWCMLHSSKDGYSVYQNLGFQTVELWSNWVSSP